MSTAVKERSSTEFIPIALSTAAWLKQTPQTGIAGVAKRLLDLAVGTAALIAVSPLMLIIAAAIVLETGRPVLFSQERVGRGGRRFKVYKFRSMVPDAESRRTEVESNNEITDGPIFKWRRDPRITRIGRIIRKTSLDELPQLYNVIAGSMSLVGPRPPLENEVLHYEDWQLGRLRVTPGMTGLWQVSGRSNLSFTDMVKLDIQYVEHWSPLADIKLLLRTPLAVMRGRGAF